MTFKIHFYGMDCSAKRGTWPQSSAVADEVTCGLCRRRLVAQAVKAA